MKPILTFALFLLVAASSLEAPANAYQKWQVTYAANGIMDGQAYNAITLDYYNHWMTFHFVGGGEFTQAVTNDDLWNELVRRLRSANLPPD